MEGKNSHQHIIQKIKKYNNIFMNGLSNSFDEKCSPLKHYKY